MLFNSHVFIFAFLPIVFFGFFWIGKYRHDLAALWLTTASLFFYCWWDVRFVGLLVGSIAFNYSAAYLIGKKITGQSKLLLTGAIAGNLILLGYFKYANFFADNFNRLAGTAIPIGEVFLPLGISFFTFTQIAFLVDTYKGKAKEHNFLHYTLFVTYFPHLIAGPVLHHKEMMPQFAKPDVCRLNINNVAAGLGIFVLGLAKKLLIADCLAGIATPVFNTLATIGHPMLGEAWIGALAYTLQLYFDFSAYSDMAIGLSLMFNVRLPMNFNSPYKSTSIIEFWRRWHMTLSSFLRDYLYIPLGGSRNGKFQRYLNLIITMLLGGLWHGAGWTFIVWGGLHGFYLIVNHAWRSLKQRLGWGNGGPIAAIGACAVTFTATMVGWVFFRADSCSSAMDMLGGMVGMNGVSVPRALEGVFGKLGLRYDWIVFDKLMPLSNLYIMEVLPILAIGLGIAWGFPNTRELFLSHRPTCNDLESTNYLPMAEDSPGNQLLRFLRWRPSGLQGAFYGALFFILILYMTSAEKSEFLYFQF
ncbi:MAG: hypothetical protein JWL59_1091 [Chthoniobacteraceae bacterium]|nr:hypothetical protein [Chthoniobacteraceae bacterium]